MFASKATPEKHAHVIVCGNEKCGSGKTITAMQIIVSLLNEDFRVASIDLDIRQMRLTRYIQNREYWAAKNDRSWPMPQHFLLEKGGSDSVLENENAELSSFSGILQRVERLSDFIVIDTPGHDSYLTRRARSLADPLITPLNDSCLDFDGFGRIDLITGDVLEVSQYAGMVREARRHRRSVDNGLLDWVVIRNRLS